MKYVFLLPILFLTACGEDKPNTSISGASCSIAQELIGAWSAGAGDAIQFNSNCTGKTTPNCGLLFKINGATSGVSGSANVDVTQGAGNSSCLGTGNHSCVYMIQETGNAISGIQTYLLFNCGNGNQIYQKLPAGNTI